MGPYFMSHFLTQSFWRRNGLSLSLIVAEITWHNVCLISHLPFDHFDGFYTNFLFDCRSCWETFAVQNCTACAQKTLHMRICKPTLTFRHVQQNSCAVHMQYLNLAVTSNSVLAHSDQYITFHKVAARKKMRVRHICNIYIFHCTKCNTSRRPF